MDCDCAVCLTLRRLLPLIAENVGHRGFLAFCGAKLRVLETELRDELWKIQGSARPPNPPPGFAAARLVTGAGTGAPPLPPPVLPPPAQPAHSSASSHSKPVPQLHLAVKAKPAEPTNSEGNPGPVKTEETDQNLNKGPLEELKQPEDTTHRKKKEKRKDKDRHRKAEEEAFEESKSSKRKRVSSSPSLTKKDKHRSRSPIRSKRHSGERSEKGEEVTPRRKERKHKDLEDPRQERRPREPSYSPPPRPNHQKGGGKGKAGKVLSQSRIIRVGP